LDVDIQGCANIWMCQYNYGFWRYLPICFPSFGTWQQDQPNLSE
jgi:hypothetical protein